MSDDIDERVRATQTRIDQTLEVLRADPSALGISSAWALGYHQGRLELLNVLTAIKPTAFYNSSAQGPEWVAAIPVEKLRQVIEETTPEVTPHG